MPDTQIHPLWTKILTITASVCAAVAVSIGGYVINNFAEHLEILRGFSSGMAVSLAENSTQIEYISEQISRLMADTKARPDPFTGTDGRILRGIIDSNERRIDDVERGVSAVAALTERIELVEKSQRNYQAAMIPLIQQSNTLQLQRMNKGMGDNGP